ncbi:FecR domain-containing protein [Flavobacteriaceae bacterium F89]|uniref:FecR domain-containing protein n=1 Tax=Cerina litoralis TaxID=2874477 RepID=A0AAE3EYT1_9FLAO|nr:FecR domain-containing protein [Cerina litoralis]MCG2462828.1 FecR domain-containing protein [Cerina litoralis]
MQNEKNILKWLNGELQGEALEKFKSTEDFRGLQPIMERTSAFRKPNFDTEKALSDFKALRKSRAEMKIRKPWRAISAVAASLLVLISLYFIWNDQATTINTAYAETATVQLPDASEVIVNAGSTLSFNKNKWDRDREVTLKGEAFFKVSKGKKFTVLTNQGNVSVLGTQFNVSERGESFKVACFTGKVAVEVKGQQFILTPGKSIAVSEGNIGKIVDFRETAPDWIQNKSTFADVPFPVVIAELERQYAIKVEVDRNLLQKNFTGAFVHDNLELALNSICFPLNLDYKILNDDTVRLYAKK